LLTLTLQSSKNRSYYILETLHSKGATSTQNGEASKDLLFGFYLLKSGKGRACYLRLPPQIMEDGGIGYRTMLLYDIEQSALDGLVSLEKEENRRAWVSGDKDWRKSRNGFDQGAGCNAARDLW